MIQSNYIKLNPVRTATRDIILVERSGGGPLGRWIYSNDCKTLVARKPKRFATSLEQLSRIIEVRLDSMVDVYMGR